MKKKAWNAMENVKGKKVPVAKLGRTTDHRPPETKPRRSGKGGVGSGSGIPGPGALGRTKE